MPLWKELKDVMQKILCSGWGGRHCNLPFPSGLVSARETQCSARLALVYFLHVNTSLVSGLGITITCHCICLGTLEAHSMGSNTNLIIYWLRGLGQVISLGYLQKNFASVLQGTHRVVMRNYYV